jgi:hypothetical protein
MASPSTDSWLLSYTAHNTTRKPYVVACPNWPHGKIRVTTQSSYVSQNSDRQSR